MRPPSSLVVHFFVNKLYVLLSLIGIYVVACRDEDVGAILAIGFVYLHLTYLAAATTAKNPTNPANP